MNRDEFVAQISFDEGKRLLPYRDTRGYLTVGVGHLVGPQDAVKEGISITEEQCQTMLDHDIDRAIWVCQHLLPTFDTLPEVAQQVLANMAFNLGGIRLGGFAHMLDAIKKGQWLRVATEMRNSAWYFQVPHRAQRLIDKIMTLVPSQTGLH